jgi:cell division protein FtsA
MFPGGIVITGGGALLRGFAEIVQQQTNLPARVAAPQGLQGMNDEIRGPSHATVVGLLRWGARSNLGRKPSRSNGKSSDGPAAGIKLSRWFRDLF